MTLLWQLRRANLMKMKLFLQRFDIVGNGTLYGQGIVGFVEPRQDAVEWYAETGYCYWTAVCYWRIAAHRRLDNTQFKYTTGHNT